MTRNSTRNFFHGLLLVSMLLLPASARAWQDSGDAEMQWYKGNLHTHSLWSDGNDFPEMITRWYAQRDYHFLALTDHNVLSRGERWMPVERIEARGGEQALPKYLAAYGDEWVETRDDVVKNDNGEEASRPMVRLKGLAEYRSLFEKPGRFLLLTGEEISDSVDGLPVHMNATNLKELIRPAGGESVREAIANNMRSAIEQARSTGQEILVHLNHPNFGWAITAEDLAMVTEERFFEIYNGHPSVRQAGDDLHPSVEKIWDICNTIRLAKLKAPPLFGLATDDSHYYHGRPGSQPGRGWIMVRADQLEPETLVRQIKAGDFYASSGVSLKAIRFDESNRTLSLEIDGVEGETYRTTFVGTPREYDDTTVQRTDADGKPVRATRVYSPDIGKTLATVPGNNPRYQMTGDELYVRAIVTSSADHPNPSMKDQKQQAWTQPVGWRLESQ